MIEISIIYAKLMNQCNFKHQLTFLVIVSNHGEHNGKISGIELPITLSITHKLTQSDIDNNIIQ